MLISTIVLIIWGLVYLIDKTPLFAWWWILIMYIAEVVVYVLIWLIFVFIIAWFTER